MTIIMFTMGIAMGFQKFLHFEALFLEKNDEKEGKRTKKRKKSEIIFQILKEIMKKETKKRKELFSRAV